MRMHSVHLYEILLSDQALGAHQWYKMNFIATTALISGSHRSDPHWQLECVCVLSGSCQEKSQVQGSCALAFLPHYCMYCSRPLFCCTTHTARLVIALSLRLRGYDPGDWHHAVCQAVQMHHVQSSLRSERSETKGLARLTKAACSDDTNEPLFSFWGYDACKRRYCL